MIAKMSVCWMFARIHIHLYHCDLVQYNAMFHKFSNNGNLLPVTVFPYHSATNKAGFKTINAIPI